MTVRELVEKLEYLDPDAQVATVVHSETNRYWFPTQAILETGFSREDFNIDDTFPETFNAVVIS